jgi:hypothetical protein
MGARGKNERSGYTLKSALWLINCVIFNSFLVYKHEIEIQSICDECGKDLGYRQDGGRKT